MEQITNKMQQNRKVCVHLIDLNQTLAKNLLKISRKREIHKNVDVWTTVFKVSNEQDNIKIGKTDKEQLNNFKDLTVNMQNEARRIQK